MAEWTQQQVDERIAEKLRETRHELQDEIPGFKFTLTGKGVPVVSQKPKQVRSTTTHATTTK